MNAPTRIGRYEIVRQLGKSMTNVYLAVDAVENRKAALKLIRSDGDAVNRMILEAERRGAEIQKEMKPLDPRVVEVYETGELDGWFFVAMEYVEGRNLAEVLQSERAIDPVRAATIALEILEQLGKFHTWQATVVHGDIKPSNIHLGPNDTVRLLDFGIAKTLRANCDATEHNFGSPGYCAPERLSRSQVDEQSDLWAVGATLYEMVTGKPPYEAENTRKLEALIQSKRPPRALPSHCPRGLRAIVSKALAPNPSQRYRSAREFQADLQLLLERKPTRAEAERRAGLSATIEAARAYLRKANRTVALARRQPEVVSALGWFALGMALWFAGYLGWHGWHAWQAHAAAAAPPAAPSEPVESAKLYTAAAERILDSYLRGSDSSLDNFDWHKAEIYLERAVRLGATDERTLGELALVRGYATLERVGGGHYADAGARRLRAYARDQFLEAVKKLPRDPAPHLALARLYVYDSPDMAKAMAEFAAAERLGAAPGRRELEQQADASRLAELKPAASVPAPAARSARGRRWR